MDAKDSVHALVDANQVLTGTAPLTIDGVNLGAATANPPKRVALTGQTTAADVMSMFINGFLVVTIPLLSPDFDTDAEVIWLIFHGNWRSLYSGYEVILTTEDPIDLGIIALSFSKYPSTLSLTAGDMMAKTGNDFTIDLFLLWFRIYYNPGNATWSIKS